MVYVINTKRNQFLVLKITILNNIMIISFLIGLIISYFIYRLASNGDCVSCGSTNSTYHFFDFPQQLHELMTDSSNSTVNVQTLSKTLGKNVQNVSLTLD